MLEQFHNTQSYIIMVKCHVITVQHKSAIFLRMTQIYMYIQSTKFETITERLRTKVKQNKNVVTMELHTWLCIAIISFD